MHARLLRADVGGDVGDPEASRVEDALLLPPERLGHREVETMAVHQREVVVDLVRFAAAGRGKEMVWAYWEGKQIVEEEDGK